MDVKTFEAFSMKDAIKAVKSEFGHDAVILRTSEKKSENSRDRIFEVVAAPAGQSQRTGATMDSIRKFESIKKDDLTDWARLLSGFRSDLKNMERQMVQRNDLSRIEASIFEIKNLLKNSLSSQKSEIFLGLDEVLCSLLEKLVLMDVDQTLLCDLKEFLAALDVSKMSSKERIFEFYQAHAVRWCLRRIRVSSSWVTETDQDQVHVFIGPSGAGKTSMLCKLARRLKQEDKKDVLILSGDINRLGASEQLRIFAKVSDMSFQCLSRPEDLDSLIDTKPGCRIILVDTPGLSPKNHDLVQSMKAYRDAKVAVNFHLCLSMTDKSDQVERSIRAFSMLGIDTLMFTKLDESWSYGEMLNTSLRWGIPLSFFGTGSRISDDLEKASRERVVERVFGL